MRRHKDMKKPAPKSYVKFYKRILLDPSISAGARLLFSIIKAHAIKTDNCWPSVATLANHLGCGRRTAEKWINELNALDLIQVIPRVKENGEKDTNLYVLKDDAFIEKKTISP